MLIDGKNNSTWLGALQEVGQIGTRYWRQIIELALDKYHGAFLSRNKKNIGHLDMCVDRMALILMCNGRK
jgi:hypothetical protein